MRYVYGRCENLSLRKMWRNFELFSCLVGIIPISNIQYGIKETTEYLERFFRNLLMGEKNELKSRYTIIGTSLDEGKVPKKSH